MRAFTGGAEQYVDFPVWDVLWMGFGTAEFIYKSFIDIRAGKQYVVVQYYCSI